MDKLVLFGGTIEGRKLTEALRGRDIQVWASVATEYGETLLDEGENIRILVGRKDGQEMAKLLRDIGPSLCVDATHPYAAQVTETIREACRETGTAYLRLLRSEDHEGAEDCIFVEDTEAAVRYLNGTEGNVLLTVGSKELAQYTAVENYDERLFARVLPLPKVVEQCAQLGFTGRNLICMQGPFTQEINEAMLQMLGARYLVTKDTGAAGGFPEKLRAAKAKGVKVIVVRRPLEEEGVSLQECLSILKSRFSLKEKKHVTILGVGAGSGGTLTIEGERACREAELILGAKRLTDSLAQFGKPAENAVLPGELTEKIRRAPYSRIVVAMSGDTGFYSGTKKLLPLLEGIEAQVLPGISSVQYLASRLGKSWDDAVVTSTHGRACNFVAKIRKNKKVFLLTGGEMDASGVIRTLSRYGLGHVQIAVGQELSYEDEEIFRGTVEELCGRSFHPLAVIYAENPQAEGAVSTQGLPDEAFLRDEVPMTKQEVRAVTLAKLGLSKTSICWDVGAGTGSVSLEMGECCEDGFVYAIEQKDEACGLIEKNKLHLGVANVQVIHGSAPEALRELPAPTHVFIGGSSGDLRAIMELALEKNADVRIVMNTVTAETFAEAVTCLRELPVHDVDMTEISVSRGRRLGRYHLMTAQNPVYVLSCTGGKDHG